jgi:hypothetical protein
MDPSKRSLAMVCPCCERVANMRILAEWSANGSNFDLPQQWTATQCHLCDEIAIYLQEIVGFDGEEDLLDSYWQVHPAQAKRLSDAVPDAVRRDFDEARDCLVKAKAFRASAAMSRKAIEDMCRAHGHTGGNLFKKLQAMLDAGVIDTRLHEWATAIREVGNEGAHGVLPVTKQDAEEVLVFVEALADYIYVYRARHEQFKTRRDARTAKALLAAAED